MVVPATALARAWRDGPRSAPIARLVDGGEVDALDEEGAKEVGRRLEARGRRDVAGAQVVCGALRHGAAVVTSDPDGIRALVDPSEPLDVFAV